MNLSLSLIDATMKMLLFLSLATVDLNGIMDTSPPTKYLYNSSGCIVAVFDVLFL